MKKVIKSFSYVLIMIVIATMVSGCSSKNNSTSATSRPFVIWSFEDEDAWKPLNSSISKAVGNKEVKYVKKTLSSSYETDALNSMLSGQGPDIWAIPNDWIYRHKDKLVAMPDALAKNADIDNKYVPAIKQNCVIDSKVVCLSPFLDTLMVYFHQDMFDSAVYEYDANNKISSSASQEEKVAFNKEKDRVHKILSYPPTVWSDFSEAAKRLTKKNGTEIIQSGAALGTSNNITEATDILYALMLQNNTNMTSDDLKLATFSLPVENSSDLEGTPAKRALDFYSSFSNPTSPNYSWNSSMPNDVQAFLQNKTAMIFGYKSLQAYFAQNYPTLQYKTAAIPQIGDSQTNVVDWSSGYSFVVPATSINSQGAWQVVSYLADGTFSLSTSAKFASSIKANNFSASLQNRDPLKPDKQAQTASSWIKGRYPVSVDNIFKSVIDKTVSVPSNSQAYLDNAALEVTDLLKKTDW